MKYDNLIFHFKEEYLLMNFLKKNNILDKFMYNLEQCDWCDDLLDLYRTVSTHYELCITCAFLWGNTKEGDGFWRGVDMRWKDYYTNEIRKNYI